MEATVRFNGTYFSLKTKYDRNIVRFIKNEFYSDYRRWDNTTRTWYIYSPLFNTLEDFLRKYRVKISVENPSNTASEVLLEIKEFTVEYLNSLNAKQIYVPPSVFPDYSGSASESIHDLINQAFAGTTPPSLGNYLTSFGNYLRRFSRSGFSGTCVFGYTFQRKVFAFSEDGLERYKNVHGVLGEKRVSFIESNNPFEILGLSDHATDDEIKGAFRALSLLHHPDRGGDVENFIKIKNAYEIVKDPVRRKKYLAIMDLMRKSNRAKREPRSKELPFTCARVKAVGFLWLGLFIVNEIIWAKRITKNGKVMASRRNDPGDPESYELFWV